MKSLRLIGLALGASLALSSAAFAEDITIAVAGPMTGGESAFGEFTPYAAVPTVTSISPTAGPTCSRAPATPPSSRGGPTTQRP